MTQALSGHGCFAAYLKRFGKLGSAECWFCGEAEDDVEHTIFKCDAWFQRRRRAETITGTDINPGNMIPTMLATRENWDAVAEMIQGIMRKKEQEKRRRQAPQT